MNSIIGQHCFKAKAHNYHSNQSSLVSICQLLFSFCAVPRIGSDGRSNLRRAHWIHLTQKHICIEILFRISLQITPSIKREICKYVTKKSMTSAISNIKAGSLNPSHSKIYLQRSIFPLQISQPFANMKTHLHRNQRHMQDNVKVWSSFWYGCFPFLPISI